MTLVCEWEYATLVLPLPRSLKNGSSPGSSYVDFGHLDSALRFVRHSKANVTEQRTGKVESWFRIVSGGK
ncbi:hypothetical protein N7453_009167 [Penicillium expansum]|nr:hypothetical protein N7453_009167 [Penicillium expansum]